MTISSHRQTLPERTERAERLARTYDGERSWERVREYRRAMRWHARHPERGSSAASQALGLPRGRIRSWFEGAKPPPLHAVETAEGHGWLDAAPGDRTFEGLVVLHAWVLAGGSIIAETFVPTCSIGAADPVDLARDAFTAVGIPSREAHADSASRGRELRPAGAGGSHLGRFLSAVFDAPIGSKTRIGPDTLAWLGAVPTPTRRRWSQTYVTLRGTPIERTRHGYAMQLGERRNDGYRSALIDVFRSVVDAESTITAAKHTVLLDDNAAVLLGQVPRLAGG